MNGMPIVAYDDSKTPQVFGDFSKTR